MRDREKTETGRETGSTREREREREKEERERERDRGSACQEHSKRQVHLQCLGCTWPCWPSFFRLDSNL